MLELSKFNITGALYHKKRGAVNGYRSFGRGWLRTSEQGSG